METMSPQLRRALESTCATSVEKVLRARNAQDLAVLRSILRSRDESSRSMRQSAIQILGRWGDREAVPAIRALLPGFDERERINAVDALGRIGGAEAEAAVLALSEDESPDVRRFAAYALARLGSSTATDRQRQMERSDPEPSTRKAAQRSLRR
ncbi:HEAT repeat domain-containing protein [Nocardia amikacinitolerans]|uniref:HEAT repeat domain-containing protein n=1 Tax=Nocardia amikacinitolerans TaxID=756689 RepID=UPI003685A9DC